jgi:ribonuclease R
MYKRKLEGKISITNSGVGYLSTEELEEDVKIESKFLNTALDGDQVKVLLFPENKQKNKQLEGEVTEIIERKKTKFVGVIDRKGKNYSFLLPDDRKMYTDIFIPHVDKKLKDGYKALVEMTSWESSKKSPVGKIIKVLGKKGSEEVEREAIVLEKGMEVDFPKEVKKEAKKIKKGSSQIKKEEIKKRRDFRDRKTFTIDPESAKDFDDALSFKKIEDDLFEIGIHIADVSTYVEKGNKIDQEARKRGFSIYMVGETVPMLPEILSNDLCSLNPNEEKLAFSAVFKMNSKGEVNDLWVGETIIESDKRYSYKQAMKKIEKGDSDLKTLNKIAKTLRKKRVNEGSLKFNTDEVIFNLDSSGKPIEIIKKEVLDTHKLIEEFMLLANRKVANKFDSDPFIFRVHEEPDEKTIQELKGFLSGLGYDVSLGDKITSEKINDIINQVEGKPVEFLVSNIILRSMTKAYYSTKNKGHFGLGFEKYTHFTSPIRRYADLETHRIIKRKLKNKSLESKTAYEAICLETSENELRALDAERESIAYKKCEYMLPQVGKTRKAIISGITQWGIYVRDLESFAEGIISLRSLQDDYYVLDKEKYRLIGRNTNKTFSLGDEVKVVVEKVDLEDKLIDFKLV